MHNTASTLIQISFLSKSPTIRSPDETTAETRSSLYFPPPAPADRIFILAGWMILKPPTNQHTTTCCHHAGLQIVVGSGLKILLLIYSDIACPFYAPVVIIFCRLEIPRSFVLISFFIRQYIEGIENLNTSRSTKEAEIEQIDRPSTKFHLFRLGNEGCAASRQHWHMSTWTYNNTNR